MLDRFRQRGFNRDTWLLLIAMSVWGIGYFGIIMLLRVLYVLRLGFGPQFVGVLGASGALTFALVSLPGGTIAAKYGVRRTMLAGVCFSILMSFLQPLATFMPSVWAGPWLVVTQIARVGGWCLFSVNFVPMLALVTLPERRGDAFALSATLRGLGNFLGTMVGGVLPAFFGRIIGQPLSEPMPYHWAIWLGSCIMVLTLIPLSRVSVGELVAKTESTDDAEPVEKFRLRDMLPLMSHVFLTHSGWAVPQNFWNAYMDSVLHMATSSIGIVTGVGQFLSMLSPMLGPILTKRRDQSWTLMVCAVGICLGLLPMVLMRDAVSLSVSRLAVLAVSAMWFPSLQAYQMGQVAEELRARAYGALQMGMGMAFATASLAGGYVIAALGYPSIFAIGAAMSGMGAGLMWRMRRQQANDEDGAESIQGSIK